MIRKELSFCIDDKFGGETTHQNEDPFKGNVEKFTVGETVEDDGFSFGSNAMNMIEEHCDENEGAEGGFVPSEYGAVDGWDPSDPLFLRNYAQFLQSRGEFFKAEEYYDRAIMADPTNGEILCLFAKLVWELYRDKEQALTYFERAALASPGDSDILGAYASFLWEMDEEEEGHFSDTQVDDQNAVSWNDMAKDFEEQKRPISPPLHLAMGLGLNVPSIIKDADVKTEPTETTDVEEYYRRMLEKNSCNALFLKDHTEFLNQSKGELQGAEEYYSRAIREDSSNWPIISQYANLMWQLYHDKERADTYFNQAIEATPRDSDILASYAKFLWEIEDEEEEDSTKSQGGLEEDEQYYLGAMRENPRNGQIMSEYASLVWRIHGDKNRADTYFKRSIQATPEDSDVLASYAKFLWEIDDDEEKDSAEEV
ncbi:uncharacterized protein [Primulina huaijiensis]|uniref:uncharacterized protein n=1 Tax=Primulina huaijiensis TaxID=1492673 RepID=UPI003CC70438